MEPLSAGECTFHVAESVTLNSIVLLVSLSKSCASSVGRSQSDVASQAAQATTAWLCARHVVIAKGAARQPTPCFWRGSASLWHDEKAAFTTNNHDDDDEILTRHDANASSYLQLTRQAHFHRKTALRRALRRAQRPARAQPPAQCPHEHSASAIRCPPHSRVTSPPSPLQQPLRVADTRRLCPQANARNVARCSPRSSTRGRPLVRTRSSHRRFSQMQRCASIARCRPIPTHTCHCPAPKQTHRHILKPPLPPPTRHD